MKLTAVDAERLIDQRVGVRTTKRRGLASRVRRIATPLADIVLTFRKADVNDADVVTALRQALEKQDAKADATLG
jgi:hypothetical protein